MKGMKIKFETINRIMEVIKPFISKDNFLALDFGTGKVTSGNENIPDMMTNKVSLSTGSEQIELGFYSEIPSAMEGLESANALKPVKKVVLRATEFAAIVEALANYESDFTFDVTDAEVVVYSGNAHLSIGVVDESQMKALIPHKLNSSDPSLFDKDILSIRFVGNELIEDTKEISVFESKASAKAQTSFVSINVKDIPLVTQEVEKNGQTINVPRYNAQVQFVNTDQIFIANSVTNCFIHKGAGKDLTSRIKDTSVLEGLTNPVISFSKGEDGLVTTATSYADFKKSYDGIRNLPESDAFLFAVPVDVMSKILRLASIDGGYIDITVGEKYITVTSKTLGFVYMTAQTPLSKMAIPSTYAKGVTGVNAGENHIVIDSKALNTSLKIAGVYEKDELVKQMGLKIILRENGITIQRGKSESVVPAISASVKGDEVVHGLGLSYLSSVASAISGNIRVAYSNEKPLFVFSKDEGAKADGSNPGVLVIGIPNIDSVNNGIVEKYEKALEEKEKKASSEKKKA